MLSNRGFNQLESSAFSCNLRQNIKKFEQLLKNEIIEICKCKYVYVN